MKVKLWPTHVFAKNNSLKILLTYPIHKNEYLQKMHKKVTSKNKSVIKHYDLNF